jgi:hypothetical protein
MTKTKSKAETNVDVVSNSKYKKTKLSAESVCVIKKALKAYITQELEVERVTALAQLCHDDFFLVLYTYKKREHSHKKINEQKKEQQMHFNTINESLNDSARLEKERTLKQL